MRRSSKTSAWISLMSFFKKKPNPLWTCCLRPCRTSRTSKGSLTCQREVHPHPCSVLCPTLLNSRRHPRPLQSRWCSSPAWLHLCLPLCCLLCRRIRKARGGSVPRGWPPLHCHELLQKPLPCPLPLCWVAASPQQQLQPLPLPLPYLWRQPLLYLFAKMRCLQQKRTRNKPEAATESQRAGHGVP